MEHATFGEIAMALLGKTIDKHMNKKFDPGKASKPVQTKIFYNYYILAPVSLYVKTQLLAATAN